MSAKNDETIQEILNSNFEDKFANSLQQIHTFIDQLIIELSSNEFSKDNHAKNLINLKSFIDNNIFEYKLRLLLNEKIESKKKDNYETKKLVNHVEKLEQDQSN